MGCFVKKVASVEQHPTKPHLDIVKLTDDSQLVSMKIENGLPRYKVDDLVAHIEHGSILTESLMKRLGVWDHEKNMGGLNGAKGNKIKRSKFDGILSEGMLLPANEIGDVSEGDDVAETLEITF